MVVGDNKTFLPVDNQARPQAFNDAVGEAISVNAVPVPAAAWLLGSALGMLGVTLRRVGGTPTGGQGNQIMTPNAVRFTNPAELARPPGYSNVVEVLRGRIVYIAGQIAVDKNGQLVGKGGFEAQAHQAFGNVGIALRSVGCTPTIERRATDSWDLRHRQLHPP